MLRYSSIRSVKSQCNCLNSDTLFLTLSILSLSTNRCLWNSSYEKIIGSKCYPYPLCYSYSSCSSSPKWPIFLITESVLDWLGWEDEAGATEVGLVLALLSFWSSMYRPVGTNINKHRLLITIIHHSNLHGAIINLEENVAMLIQRTREVWHDFHISILTTLPLPEFGFDMVLFGYGIESPLSDGNGDLVGHL